MKKQTKFLILAVFFLNCSLGCAANSLFAEDKDLVSKDSKESLTNTAFVLETNDGDAAESLERISGKVDMGFSAPENTYQTEERPGAGPFAKEKAEEKKQGNAAY